MAADERKVIFSSYIVPKESADSEESIPQKWALLAQDSSANAMAKTFGGKGSVATNVDQWAHASMFWEDQDDNWENAYDYWAGEADIGTVSGVQLSVRTTDLAFCYIKNTGDTNDLSVAIDGGTDYYILVPPGASVNLRGAGSNNCSNIYVKAVGGDTTVEYIIAEI